MIKARGRETYGKSDKNAAQPSSGRVAGRTVRPKTQEGFNRCHHALRYRLENGGEGVRVNIIGIGPHGPSFAEYQASKWLHMEGWRKML